MKTMFLRTVLLAFGLTFLLVACGAEGDVSTSQPAPTAEPQLTTAPEPTPEPEEIGLPQGPTVETMVRDSGLMVTVQTLGGMTVHSLTAPEQLFADSTHIVEGESSLVLIDTQFLLPMALDYRAYADSLGKPIDRLIITHGHPDHFLGGEAFADVPTHALAATVETIAANGQAEVDEKQAEFGDAIASTFVVPSVLEEGVVEIDGITFEFTEVRNAEAEVQLVTSLPDYDVVSVGDIVYSGVHLILAGPPPTWIEALESLQAKSSESTIVLAGHGVPGTAALYDDNIVWLTKAAELLGEDGSAESFKSGLVEAFPDLGMDAAIDFVLPFFFPDEASAPAEPTAGLVEVILVTLAEGAPADAFLSDNQAIEDNYASRQPGYLARETAVSEDGQWRISIHWESKEDSDNSIAGFGEAPGVTDFMSHLNLDSMVIKQYEVHSDAGQVTFPDAGVVEVISVRLQDGADIDEFLEANKTIEENYVVEQPGFIARETVASEDGEWLIIVHWESAQNSADSIAGFGEAPGVEEFMSFLDTETMNITVYDIQQ